MTQERDEAIRAFWRALRVTDSFRFELWGSMGLTLQQLRVMCLSTQCCSAGDIALTIEASPATVTGLTTRLVRNGMLHCERDIEDRRVKRFSLTAAGAQALLEGSVAARAHLGNVLGRLSPAAAVQLADSLAQFVAAAEAIEREIDVRTRPR